MACVFSLWGSVVFGQSQTTSPGKSSPGKASPPQSTPPQKILPLIEKYKAPPYPKSLYLTGETYDYRIKSRSPLPATRTDTFVCDIWQRVTMDLKLTLTPEQVSEEVIKQAMNIYLTRKWDDIAGYRPWTHANFIKSLKAPQRDSLAKELLEYIGKNGVRDVKE
nr:Unknown Function [uncultured bacterium]AIA13051.1 Unknown Function [uncultured bacterium]